VISETTARRLWPDEDPIGKPVRLSASSGFSEPKGGRRVVGVVSDLVSQSLTDASGMEVYVPHAQSGGDYLTLVVRGEGGRTPDLAALEEVVREADPGLALIRPATLREVVNREMVAPKFYTSLLAAFAGLAVLLTAIGLYGVVAFRVSSRRREIGIRMAVGGEAWRIVRQILWGALTPAALGVLAGLLAALALTRLLGGLLYNVRPHDPITWVGVTFLVLAIVILASSLPASRASRVAPSEVLREE
jgi:hypothetical protein